MLRIATPNDYKLVEEMALKFLGATPYSDHFDLTTVDLVIKHFLSPDNNNDHIVLLAEDQGMIAGMTAPFYFGTKLMATEVGWWVEPEARKSGVGTELIKAFEYWAKKVGCSLVTMVSLDEEVGKYYEKNGYTLCERFYLKELN